MIKEGKIEGKNFMFNGWFRWIVGSLIGALWLVLFTVITVMGNNIITNDKESRERDDKIYDLAMNNRSKFEKIEAKLDEIRNTQEEFKQILKRTIPRIKE